ncbi:MAG TPA: hypoxanthine phosphoribosyltransferase [Planctomicrobium sp.]|nr:hypoxanthine phosphoribosyltransferase [Planctomicrobium sp.]
MDHIRPLIDAKTISDAVQELGNRLTSDYTGRELTVLGILTGSIVLVSDLIRQISVPHQLGFIPASSYRGTATAPGELALDLQFLPEIAGRDVLLVDDIFDTGRTLSTIQSKLLEFSPKSVQTVALLWKTSRREVDCVPDYFCFEIPDEFVVGYGLDYNEHYRHLPYLGVLE